VRHFQSSEQQNFIAKDLSNTLVNFEKYYKVTKDGYYSIHFLNKNCFTIEEIKILFSFYGNIVHMYDNNKGLVFVKYRTLTETINCLKALQNILNILPQKEKIDNTNKETDQDTNLQTSIRINSGSSYDRTSLESGNKSVLNIRSNSVNRFDKIDGSSNNSPNSKPDSTSNINIEKDKSIFVSSEKHAFSLRQETCTSDGIFDSNFVQEPFRSNISSHSLTKCDTNNYIDNNVYNDSKIPNLINNTEMEHEDFGTTSNCSLLADLRNASSKIFIMPMQEVIVANIHANYGMHYILHLFGKFNPVAATSVKTISETNIRYCHVYFETVQNAMAVEKEFDNFFLSGKNLIVLRKLQLIEKAKTK